MLVTSAIVGRAIAHSSAIWPSPRMPISAITISVVGLEPEQRERQPDLVVETPLGGDGLGMRCAERAEDVLRRRLPGRADDGDHLRAAPGANERGEGGERGVLVVRDERGRSSRARLVHVPNARVQRDEEVSGPDLAGVGPDRGDDGAGFQAVEPPEAKRGELVERERDHVDLFTVLLHFRCLAPEVSRMRADLCTDLLTKTCAAE